MPIYPPFITVKTSVLPSKRFKISPEPACLIERAVAVPVALMVVVAKAVVPDMIKSPETARLPVILKSEPDGAIVKSPPESTVNCE